MEQMSVQDLMVPIEEYATVSQDATLFEAVLALEHAQEKLDRMQYSYLHRAILVFDENKKRMKKVAVLINAEIKIFEDLPEKLVPVFVLHEYLHVKNMSHIEILPFELAAVRELGVAAEYL